LFEKEINEYIEGIYENLTPEEKKTLERKFKFEINFPMEWFTHINSPENIPSVPLIGVCPMCSHLIGSYYCSYCGKFKLEKHSELI